MPAEALEIRGPAGELLDEPFALRVRGAGPDAELTWRARYRDDDDRIWKTAAARPQDLTCGWVAAKETTGAVAALRSLRPVAIELRAEAPDGRAAARTVTRLLAADGVRSRRWRDGLAATLHVPAEAPCATVILDASGGGAEDARAGAPGDAEGARGDATCDAGAATRASGEAAAALAAPLLASRGVLVLVLSPGRGRAAADPLALALARERIAAVPGAGEPVVLSQVPLPPNVGARCTREQAQARAAAWDALLAELGARPRA